MCEKIKCNYCDKMYDTEKQMGRHVRESHNEYLPIKCEICGVRFESLGGLQRHLTSTHLYDDNMRLDYYDTYIKKDDEGSCKQCGKRLKLVKGRFSEGYMKFCYNTDCNVKWHNKNTDRLEKFSESFKETLKENPHNNNSTLEYWTHRGYSEHDARVKQSQRQTTFSKDICIEKYGDIEGLNVWKERQDKWLDNINSKPVEELMRINRLKAYSSGCISKAEKTICEELKMDSQFTISKDIGYVYDMVKGLKIIEYNGDYWHCNPNKYDADFYNKSTKMYAHEKWEYDRVKHQYAIDSGYEVLTIWESDYNADKEKVIAQCLEFLRD